METNRLVDFLSVVDVNHTSTWERLTANVNKAFEKHCPVNLLDRDKSKYTLALKLEVS